MDALTEASGYESWFVSARDPASDRALWIRHTRHRPVEGLKGSESAALWCTAVGRDLGERRSWSRWLELVLARIRVGPARSPWTAMGALGLGGDRIVLGGLGRRPLPEG